MYFMNYSTLLIMSTSVFDYILFMLLVLFFLAPPIYLWLKWIKGAYKIGSRIDQITSTLSFILFISGFIISWFGPEDPFVKNSLELTLTGVYLVFHFFLAFSIPIVYFYTRWVFKAINNKDWITVSFRLGIAFLLIVYLFIL